MRLIERRMQMDLRALVDRYIARGYQLFRIEPLTLKRGRSVVEVRRGALVMS